MEVHVCIDCKQQFVVSESSESYTEAPYWWGRDGFDYCLACWLGVGPNDPPGVHAAS